MNGGGCIDLDYYSSYSYALYYSWNRHGKILLGHAVMDATEVWLDPTGNRAHNRVVSTTICNDPNALEDMQAFFASRQPCIQQNMATSKTIELQEATERGMQLPGSCIGHTAVRVRFLAATIAAEEALLAKLVDMPHQHALSLLRQCLQQDLRHLQRSLSSDDVEHLWKRLDDSLANSVCRI